MYHHARASLPFSKPQNRQKHMYKSLSPSLIQLIHKRRERKTSPVGIICMLLMHSIPFISHIPQHVPILCIPLTPRSIVPTISGGEETNRKIIDKSIAGLHPFLTGRILLSCLCVSFSTKKQMREEKDKRENMMNGVSLVGQEMRGSR